MNACKFNMFHNRRNINIFTVSQSVRLTFQSVFQETVNQKRTVRSYTNSFCNIFFQSIFIINDFHTATAQNKRRTNHNRVADFISKSLSFIKINSHSAFWHRNFKFFHHVAENITVFSSINRINRSTKNIYPVFLKFAGNVERSLPSKLNDNAHRLFFFINLQNIFSSNRLKIKLVRSVIISRNSFRITVYDNRFVTQFFKLHSRMTAAVVKLNSLTNSVRTAAQNHNLLFVVWCFRSICTVICWIIIISIFHAAYRNSKPGFLNSKRITAVTDCFFRNFKNLWQIFIAKTIFFSLNQKFIRWNRTNVFKHFFFQFHKFLHLLQEIIFYMSNFRKFFKRNTLTNSFIKLEITLTWSNLKHFAKFISRFFIKIFCKTKTCTTIFKPTNSLLESFLKSLTNRHNFANSFHRSTKRIFHTTEFFKSPASKFQNNIVPVRSTAWSIFIKSTVAPVRNFIQRQTRSKFCRNQRNRETSSLRGQSRRTRSTRINFNNHNATSFRIMSKLNIRTANNANRFNNLKRHFLQLFFQLFINS